MRTLLNLMGISIALSCACAVAADGTPNSVATPPNTQGRTAPAADNTAINARDKSGATPTPQKQTNAAGDRKLLADVRRAVVGDKTLSTSAHNVKIVALNGVITLRGPVRSQDEKGKVETLAQQVAGVSRVENHLDVKTN
jgi:hyperosmotically inducible protein